MGGDMDECVFCAIVSLRATASIVYRDERVTAFMDARPITLGHLLVVPNSHFPRLADVPPDVGHHLYAIGVRLATALRASGLPCDGVNLFLSDGEAAGQEVPHTHLHVVPRVPGDGFTLHAAAWSDAPPDRAGLEATAEAIRAAVMSLVPSSP